MLVTYQNNNIYYQITNYYKQWLDKIGSARQIYAHPKNALPIRNYVPLHYIQHGEHFNICSNFGPSSIAGHLGSVNDVDFHRVEPIILSASSDKQIYLGEFDDE